MFLDLQYISDVTVYVNTNNKILLLSSPYNDITIICSVFYEPQSLNLQIQQFYWFQTVNDGKTLNITQFGKSNDTHSILDLNLNQFGINTFKCVINFLDQESSYSNIVAVALKGKQF